MNNENRTKQSSHWTESAIGILILFTLLSSSFTQGKILYRIQTGIVYPAIFALSGYSMRLAKSWRQLRDRAIHNVLYLFVPSYVFFFLSRLYDFVVRYWGSAEKWNEYVVNMRQTIYYSVPRELSGILPFGEVWLLCALFFSRLLIDLFSVISTRAFLTRKNEKFNHEFCLILILCLASGIVGIVLFKHFIFLPLNLGTALVAVLFSGMGLLLKRFEHRITGIRLYSSLAVCSVIGIYGVATNRLVDMFGLSYPGIFGGFVITCCSIYALSFALRYVHQVSFLGDFCALTARRTVILLLIAENDAIFSILWSGKLLVPSVIARVSLELALSETILQSWNVISRRNRIGIVDRVFAERYHRVFQAVYYVAMAVAYCTAIPGATLIPDLLSQFHLEYELITEISLISGAILLFVFAMKATQCVKRWPPLLMSTFIGLIIAFSVIRQDNSLYIYVVLIAASIGADIFVIGKIAWIAGLVLIVSAYLLSMNGYIPYNVVYSNNLTGHAFGFNHKNTLASFIIANLTAYCMSRKNNKRIWIIVDILLMGFAIFANQRYIGGKSDLVMTIILLVGTIVYRFVGDERRRNKIFRTLEKWIHYIVGVPIYLVVLLLSVVLSWNYDGVHAPLENIIGKYFDTSTYANRMLYQKTALMVYKPKVWGQYIYQNTDMNTGAYFYIDSSYTRLILREGIIISIIFFTISTMMQFLNVKRKRYYFVFLGVLSALVGIMGERMYSLAYNIVPLCLFASSDMLLQRIDLKK